MQFPQFGRIEIPPGPPAVVFTDRDDGTLWQLAVRDVNGAPHMALVSPPAPGTRAYGPLDGPRLHLPDGRRVKLLVRGGRLGYEEDNSGVSTPPVNTTTDSPPVVIYVLSLTMLGAAPKASPVEP